MTFLLLLCFAAALLVLAELLARLWIRRGGYRVWHPGKHETMFPDLELHPYLEPKVRFFINEFGERGNSRAKGLSSDPRDQLWLFVGGSAVESFMIDQASTWPERFLFHYLQTTSDRLPAVANIGRSGVDSGSLLIMFEKLLPRYQQQISTIVIMVGASDILRWLESGASPTTPVAPLPISELFACHPEVAFGFRPKELALYEMFQRLGERIPREKENALRWYRRARTMFLNATKIIKETPDASVPLENFRGNLRALIKQAKRSAKNVVVIPQPWFHKSEYTPEELSRFWNGGIGKAYNEVVTTYYSPQVINALMGQIASCIKDVSAIEGAILIDVRSSLPSIIENYMDQFHLTPDGSEQFARLLASELRKHLPPS